MNFENNNYISNLDPFVNYAESNFVLGIGSIARNAGDSTYLMSSLKINNLLTQTDVFGRPRVNMSGNIGMGALEDTLIDALLKKTKISFQVKKQNNNRIKIETDINENCYEKNYSKGRS